MGGRTAWTSPAGCPPSCWSCASWRCFSSPGQGRHSPLLLGAPQENIPPAVAEAALAIALEGISCDWLWCKQMKSRLCILETIKPLKVILDSAMASKMKNIDPKKSSLFNLEDGFHPKKIHGLSENQTLYVKFVQKKRKNHFENSSQSCPCPITEHLCPLKDLPASPPHPAPHKLHQAAS